MAYYRQYGVDVRIARIFNSYGPRLDPESRYARVIPRFIMQALRNEPITIHGDGMQTRSFTYVTDTVNALIKMLINDGVRGEVVNIGSQNEVKIIDLAKMIIRLTGSSSKIVFTEARPDDPRRRCPDISKARKLLNWEPKISLEDGLKYTIEWFRRQLNG
jgi:UDP-glucuronate decarboxylase